VCRTPITDFFSISQLPTFRSQPSDFASSELVEGRIPTSDFHLL
jgi:hypothetical protein